MTRFRIVLSVLCCLSVLLLANACTTATGGSTEGAGWAIKGTWTDSCCCKVTCPCLAGEKPTEGFCQGASLLEVASGHNGDVNLDGTTAIVAYHVRDWTRVYVDDSATDAQVEALAEVIPKVLPFVSKGKVESVEKTSVTVERGEDSG